MGENCWIFVKKLGSNTPLEIRMRRLIGKEWPLYKLTRHRNEVTVGDKIIFYATTPHTFFWGCAKVASIERNGSELIVLLSNQKLFEKTIPAKSVASRLSFVKNPVQWGSYFQAGILRMTLGDYKFLLLKGKS